MSNPIKILYIIDSFSSPYAGTEGQLHKLVSGLDRNAFEPHLILFNRSEFIERNGFSCKVSVLGSSKLSSLKTWWGLFKLLKKLKSEGYRLVHIFFNDPSIIAPPLLKLLGMTSIISRRDMGYWYTSGYLKALRFNAKLVDAVIVNSEAVKGVTCDKEGYPPNRVSVIYNGYKEKCIDPSKKIDLHKAEGEIVLGVVANIRPIKRMQDAINALAALTQRGHQVRLVIVGGGDSDSLKKLAAELGVTDCIEFVGAQSEPSHFIQGFDICLLCSESEGFSNAIVEYMQHAKPVVCSAVGGNPECVEDSETGYLYRPGDIDSLVDKLEPLIKSAELRETVGKAAVEKVKQFYSMERMLDLHVTQYKTLI